MGLTKKFSTSNKSLELILAEFQKQKHPKKSLEEILAESYEQEHSNTVKGAKEDYYSWIELIIWDILEIQSAYKKHKEATNVQKYQDCFNLLCRRFNIIKEDVEILNNQNETKEIKIVDASKSNWHLVELVGYMEETLGILNEQHQQKFTLSLNDMKNAIRNFVTNTNSKNVKDFIWAEETWNKLPQKDKYQILHDLKDIVEEEGPDKEWLKT